MHLKAIAQSHEIDPVLLWTKRLDDGNVEWRGRAVGALARLDDPRARQALCRALGDEVVPVRLLAQESLVHCGAPAVPELCAALQGGSLLARELAAEALGKIGDRRAVGPLCHAVAQDETWVRMKAAEALGCLGDAAAADVLYQALQSGAFGLCEPAADALAALGAAGLAALGRALRHRNWYVRKISLEALRKSGRIEAAVPLCQALKDQRAFLRTAAAVALGELGSSAALPALRDRLRPLLGERDPEVRDAVEAAIKRIERVTAATTGLPRAADATPDAAGLPRTITAAPTPDGRPRAEPPCQCTAEGAESLRIADRG